jgi:oligoribonuclease NrnB/cAMP/cGMP phosphodiesterase (DHH superfamily)
MKQVCLYHGVDLDGFCGGAIFERYMICNGKEHELIPANYGMDVPWERLEGNVVTLVDFSLQFKDMLLLREIAAGIIWIDHHKSAIKEFDESQKEFSCGPDRVFVAILDTAMSGCELAWKHFFPERQMPRAVHLLGRYDVWDHAEPDVLPFQYGLRLYDMRPRDGIDSWRWCVLLGECDLSEYVRDGRSVLIYESKSNKRIVSRLAFEQEWRGETWLMANAGGGSKLFDSVWDDEYAGMVSFQWTGTQYAVSLYTHKPEIDCGAIAKEYGGGGHPGAAGFKCRTLPFDICGRPVI